DAMRLVHGDQGGRPLREHLREAGDAEALRCNEEEVEPAGEVVDTRSARVGPVAAGRGGATDSLLVRAKVGEAECAPEQGAEILRGGGRARALGRGRERGS